MTLASVSTGAVQLRLEAGYQINAAGQRQENNEYDVDGSGLNSASRDGVVNPSPEPDFIQAIRVSGATFDAAKEFVTKLGKHIAVSEDFPAFIVNRVLLPMINEAIYTLYEGVGNVEAIDAAMKLGAHHPMGPLELADFIGLDTCLSVMQVLHEGLADSKYRPCPLLVKYVEAGWLGRKTQRGFYDYRGDKPVPTR